MVESAYLRLKNACVDVCENIRDREYDIGLVMDTAEFNAMNVTARRKLSAAKSALMKADMFISDFIEHLGYERRIS